MKAFTAFILLLLFNLPLTANPEKPEEVSLRILCLYPVKMPKLYAVSGEKLVPLKFSHIEPSKAVLVDRLKGGIPIYKEGTVPEDGKPPAHLVKLPGVVKHVLLLAWMKEDDTPGFHAFPDDSITAGRKDWVVINSSTQHVGMQIGKDEEPVGVKAGTHERIRVDVPANTGSAVTIAAKLEESWKPFFTGYWAIYENKSCLILIIQDGKKMRVRQIFQEVAKKPEP